jgi:hypothetical protein
VVRIPLQVPDWCFVSEYDFSRQMEYLHRHFRVIPLSQAADDLRENRIDGPTAVITFDDGYQNVHDLAFPVLMRYELPSTVFINTAFINTANTVWFCLLNQAISETKYQQLSWEGREYDLSDKTNRARTSVKLQAMLKRLPHQELLDKLAAIQRELGIRASVEIAADSPAAAVTTREGASTMTTPSLELCRYGIGAGLSVLPFILRVHHLLP